MKRFLVFAGDKYYPNGGWNDFKGDFDSMTDASDYICSLNKNWYQIVDIKTAKIITGETI